MIRDLAKRIDKDFVNAVHSILKSKGRVIITGIGKSAIIGQKIVSTLNSTGTPSVFMHAADAIHGDLGIIQKSDVVICISNSGNSPEIKVLVPYLKSGKNLLIGMCGNLDSFLAKESDLLLKAVVKTEACPNNLAPTSSTTAQLAMGDALAVCLLEQRGFTQKDFAKYHPGGSLGKKLYLRVKDLSKLHESPMVKPDSSIQEIIYEISSRRLGATAVIDKQKLFGIITDGDLRRMMEKHKEFNHLKARDILSKNPITVSAETLAIDAFNLMKRHNITQLLVINGNKFAGFVHLHDLLKEGIM
ncbi:MAG TPA: KpsF/GutQ family sugar-phosphate isomerase [Bacteroidia bacterium]|nr:KpsF/GutQ family sugar-phosphate isomerase [Bacteroidia bacterium]HNT80012.1 KpsF/GutQ family sugar-phosphate isomerase [Bacteroidia bacterium]